MKFLITCCPLILAVILTACSGSFSEKETQAIRTVAIVNSFPAYPMYAKVGVSLVKPAYPTVNDSIFKVYIGQYLAERLRDAGYSVRLNPNQEETPATERAGVDLIIEIVPTEVEDLTESYGYGYYHRSLLGMMKMSKSYVSLRLETNVAGDIRCSGCNGESVTELSLYDLPDNWIELKRSDKEQLEKILKADIKSAIDQAFAQTGL